MSFWRQTTRDDGTREITVGLADDIYSPAQMRYMLDPSPRIIVVAGRGGGKDACGLRRDVNGSLVDWDARRRNHTWQRDGARYVMAVIAGSEQNFAECVDKLHGLIPKVPGRAPDGSKNYVFNSEKTQWSLFGRNELVIKTVNLFRSLHSKETSEGVRRGRHRGPGYDRALVTEAQLITTDVLESDVFPMIFRPGYPGRCTLNGTPDNNWFDAAADQAESGTGYYGNWSLHTFTTFDNPLLTADMAAQIAMERERNPWKFARERLARRNVQIPADVAPDCPFRAGLLECAYTDERITLADGVPALVSWDLFYGGNDEMVRTVWHKQRRALVRVDVWDRKNFRFDVTSPDYAAFRSLFEQTAQRFPGCVQVYDATGPYGSSLAAHLPRHLRTIPVVRNNPTKNRHVGDLILRLESRDNAGRSMGIVLPNPRDYPFEDELQRRNVRKLVDQLTHYRLISETKTGTPTVRYTKGDGYGDDFVDSVTIACSQLPPVGRGGLKIGTGTARLFG